MSPQYYKIQAIGKMTPSKIGLNKHLCHIKRINSPACPNCNNTPNKTIQHFLFECNRYQWEWFTIQRKLGHLTINLLYLLTNSTVTTPILKYIHSTRWFKQTFGNLHKNPWKEPFTPEPTLSIIYVYSPPMNLWSLLHTGHNQSQYIPNNQLTLQPEFPTNPTGSLYRDAPSPLQYTVGYVNHHTTTIYTTKLQGCLRAREGLLRTGVGYTGLLILCCHISEGVALR